MRNFVMDRFSRLTRDQSIYFCCIKDSLSKLFVFYLQPNESELKFV